MITEDYVSFETAKLLKEKGFNEDSWFHFDSDGDIVTRGYRLNRPDEIPAWTLQIAMKWLREVHRIEINIVLTELNYDNTRKYQFDVFSGNVNDDFDSVQRYGFNTYEQACEEAIKYCLENLI